MDWYQQFFQVGPIPADAMTGYYNIYLVILSFIIASLASYVALDMSTHLRRPTTPLFRVIWLSAGAFVMGAGIWSMHFVGMLAFIMPMPMSYDLFWTGLSMVVAVGAAALAFTFFMIKKPKTYQYALSGILLGSAIPTMHYTGMAGMEGVHIHYLLGPFLLSILIAIVAACAALGLAVISDKGSFAKRAQLKLFSGIVMGVAICGMHYMGMYAAVFTGMGAMMHGTFSLDPKLMAIFITTIVISIMAIAMVLSTSKYYITTVLQNEKDFLEVVLNNIRGGVVACDNKGKVNVWNKALESIFGGDTTKSFKSEDPKNTFPLLLKALSGEQIKDEEITTSNQEGEEKTLIADGQPLQNMEGQNIGAVIVYYDITQKKQAELELQEETQKRALAQKKLDELNTQLISAARRAGMAEIATSVLHNIGNIMNSVNVASLSLQEELNETQLDGLSEVSKLIKENKQDLNRFFSEDPKGAVAIQYISRVSDLWQERKQIFLKEIQNINKNVQIIKDIIVSQQSLSKLIGIIEKVELNKMLDEAIKITESTFSKADVTIDRTYEADITISTDASKLLQVLVNLVRNAFEAVLDTRVEPKKISIKSHLTNNGMVEIQIIDNGKGIKEEFITKMFSYGFTTKKKGHGIGLHTSALTAKELGGNLIAKSEGENKGSTFILCLPIKSPHKMDKNHDE